METIIPLKALDSEKYGRVICYPKYNPDIFSKRVNGMMELGIKSICFTGNKIVEGIHVLGKGCTGIVVLAITGDNIRTALKISRTDSEEARIVHEAMMLRVANSVEVGPKLIGFKDGLLLMEYIEGKIFPEWIIGLNGEGEAHLRLRDALRDLLEQCWRLDAAGLDHGELRRADKHIIVDVKCKAHIVDFEAASDKRKAANVTSISQYLFIKSGVSESLAKMFKRTERSRLISILRKYKMNRSRENFNLILNALGL